MPVATNGPPLPTSLNHKHLLIAGLFGLPGNESDHRKEAMPEPHAGVVNKTPEIGQCPAGWLTTAPCRATQSEGLALLYGN
jgi:hypothetical protein